VTAGETLKEVWSKDRTRSSKQMGTLVSMLGALYEIPVAEDKRFLEREKVLFAEHCFVWIAQRQQ
jgi:hypothetical protein